eukprot:5873815-Pleurochrysis_carterae.AAC.6
MPQPPSRASSRDTDASLNDDLSAWQVRQPPSLTRNPFATSRTSTHPLSPSNHSKLQTLVVPPRSCHRHEQPTFTSCAPCWCSQCACAARLLLRVALCALATHTPRPVWTLQCQTTCFVPQRPSVSLGPVREWCMGVSGCTIPGVGPNRAAPHPPVHIWLPPKPPSGLLKHASAKSPFTRALTAPFLEACTVLPSFRRFWFMATSSTQRMSQSPSLGRFKSHPKLKRSFALFHPLLQDESLRALRRSALARDRRDDLSHVSLACMQAGEANATEKVSRIIRQLEAAAKAA